MLDSGTVGSCGEYTGSDWVIGAPPVGTDPSRVHQFLQYFEDCKSLNWIEIPEVKLVQIDVASLEPT